AVVEICRQLDGIPLGIELAASRSAIYWAASTTGSATPMLVWKPSTADFSTRFRRRISLGLVVCTWRRISPNNGSRCAAKCLRVAATLAAISKRAWLWPCRPQARMTRRWRCRGLLATADATDNPHVASYILLGYGIAHRHADPVAAYGVHRRGLEIAQRSGNRELESYHAGNLARLAVSHGEITVGLESLRFAIQV